MCWNGNTWTTRSALPREVHGVRPCGLASDAITAAASVHTQKRWERHRRFPGTTTGSFQDPDNFRPTRVWRDRVYRVSLVATRVTTEAQTRITEKRMPMKSAPLLKSALPVISETRSH